jgi:hypothetical protein
MNNYLGRRRTRLAVLVLFFALCWLIAGAGSARAAGQDTPGQSPPNTPPGLSRGQQAIDNLGSRIRGVAAEYGLSSAELRDLFLSDHTLHVDGNGELLYIDDMWPADEAVNQVGQAAPAAAPFDTADTFFLHSLPGADHVIYLDFTGHTTVGTTWNSAYGISTIVSPPYDIDGDDSTFNATEIERIQRAWQIVSEDFSPFDVDVTTEDPGPTALSRQGGGDTQWGTRVVITDDTFANCGCGGHAYIGSFDDSQDEPVFVYNSSLAGVAEASSHEVGHALNLAHDGTSTSTYYLGHGSGSTSWAPLMGASYYVNVTHWSKGEYYDANNDRANANYGNGPDDLAVISSLSNGNGFGYRPDDHGDSDQAATPLTNTAGAVSGTGIVERTGDVDVFSFVTGSGQVTLDITPAVPLPNLDVLATLYDSGGGLVATSNPSSLLSGSFSLSLGQGTYYLHVDGTGVGSPLSSSPTGYTEYGSLGQYSVSGTVVDVGGGNNPPAFNSDPLVKGNATEDAAYSGSLAGDASDPDVGDTLTFSKVSGPAWLTVAGNGALSGTPANGDVGLNSWTVQVSDGAGGVDTAALQITVINTNDDPAFSSDPIVEGNATEDEAYVGSLADNAGDPDVGDTLTFSKVGGPAWLNVAGDGTLSGTPGNGDVGLNSFTVQVSDGNGGSDQATLQIMVEEPVLFVDFVATGEIFVAGTVSGSYANTQANDGSAEAITERESGGKPANRHSYLEHKWTFNVQPGTSMTLFANAWAPPSSDGDAFELAYSTNDNNYTTLGQITTTSDDASYHTFSLPNDLNGTVYIRLTDTDQSTGHRELDTVYVDHLFIQSDTQLPDPPGAPSGLSATAAGASQIDLSWTDGSDNELGFYVERSPDGTGNWTPIDEVGAGVTTYSDTGLDPQTTAYYRVQAYNAGGVSAYTNVASDTTGTAGDMHVHAMIASSTPANRNRWNAIVTITILDQDGNEVVGATVSGNWSNGANGGASCVTDGSGQCSVTKSNLKSNVSSVTFTVDDVQHATNSYDSGSNVVSSIQVSQP